MARLPGVARGGFAAFVGLGPRNLFAFFLFIVSVLSLLMAILVLVAYQGVRVEFLSRLWMSWPSDEAKTIGGLAVFFAFLAGRALSVRKARRAARGTARA